MKDSYLSSESERSSNFENEVFYKGKSDISSNQIILKLFNTPLIKTRTYRIFYIVSIIFLFLCSFFLIISQIKRMPNIFQLFFLGPFIFEILILIECFLIDDDKSNDISNLIQIRYGFSFPFANIFQGLTLITYSITNYRITKGMKISYLEIIFSILSLYFFNKIYFRIKDTQSRIFLNNYLEIISFLVSISVFEGWNIIFISDCLSEIYMNIIYSFVLTLLCFYFTAYFKDIIICGLCFIYQYAYFKGESRTWHIIFPLMSLLCFLYLLLTKDCKKILYLKRFKGDEEYNSLIKFSKENSQYDTITVETK